MSASPHGDCEMALLVQAEFDGELDAAQAAAVAAHRHDCPRCRAAAAALTETRALLRDGLHQPMPEDARRRLLARLERARPAPAGPPFASRWRGWWSGLAGFGLGAAGAAALAVLLLMPGAPPGLPQDLVASHIRALQPGHLEDVASTDRHTVKPWFAGRLDFAPPVKDLTGEGFPLKGGRLDYVGGRAVAALVYQRDKHIIDLYVWPQAEVSGTPRSAELNGYNVVHWIQDGMSLWAVSDVEPNQLAEFVKDWQRAS